MRGLYIHIPFCAQKCPYCDFNSYSGKLDIAESYVGRLIDEAKTYKNQQISTVYIGGGTPSILSAELMKSLVTGIFENFEIAESAEITAEVNPGTVDENKLKVYRKIGINRLSVGVQSFDNEMLKILGRIHDSEQAKKVITTAFDVGFDNVSADLMFSYRGQTEESWISDIETAINLGIAHISCYGLKVEEGTPFHKNGMENLDEDTDRKLQEITVKLLEKSGFLRYEISNFAKTGFESRHNLIYWHCGEYIGLGAGAHSYFEGKRFNNILSPEKYIGSEKIRENEMLLTEDDKITEKFIMGMRLAEGVDEKYAADKEALEKYISEGYIKRDGTRVSFTEKGFDVSNYILSDII
ncbi:MAG: radical SAM family heme chaperone HemW [Clostridia bacterium]|nr:radical SAM family heme chaperone HemW [Clostridia bacterium]